MSLRGKVDLAVEAAEMSTNGRSRHVAYAHIILSEIYVRDEREYDLLYVL